MVFGQNLKILTLAKRIPYERASQEEQNGPIFSFAAPSGEEIMPFNCMHTVKVVTPTSTVVCANVLALFLSNRATESNKILSV